MTATDNDRFVLRFTNGSKHRRPLSPLTQAAWSSSTRKRGWGAGMRENIIGKEVPEGPSSPIRPASIKASAQARMTIQGHQ